MLKAALILLMMVVLPGCERSAPKAGPLQVRLAYTTQHDCALVRLAMAKGYFGEEGIVVQPLVCSFGKEALGLVLQGKADLATVAETPFMFAVLNGEKIAAVAGIFSSDRDNSIVANRARGIEKVGDLRGKRVGVTLGTTSEIFLDAFLAANNLARHELTIVDLTPEQMPDALAGGRVDAVSTWQPAISMIEKRLGEKCATFSDRDIFTVTFLLAAQSAYTRAHPEEVRRVLRALVKAEGFAFDHPLQARKIIAAGLRMDPDILAACWNESRFKVSLDHALLITLEEESRWAIKKGKVPGAGMPNYLDYISPEGLAAVRPEAVGIQR